MRDLTRFAPKRSRSPETLHAFPPRPPVVPPRRHPRARRFDRRACADPGEDLADKLVADRGDEVRRGLQALRLRQPRRAEGRHLQRRGGRHFRQLQSFIVRGTPAAGLGGFGGMPLRHADAAGDGRAGHQPCPHRRSLHLSGRLLLRHLPPRPGGEMARRKADHRRGRGLVVRGAEGQQSALRPLLRQRDRGEGDLRARGPVHLRPEGQPGAAAHHGST